VYFEGSHPAEEPPRHFAGGAPPILYVPTFLWKYFFFMEHEKSQEIKRELFM